MLPAMRTMALGFGAFVACACVAAVVCGASEVRIVYPPPHRVHYLLASKLRVRVEAVAAPEACGTRTCSVCIELSGEGLESVGGCQPLAASGAQSFLADVSEQARGAYDLDAWLDESS